MHGLAITIQCAMDFYYIIFLARAPPSPEQLPTRAGARPPSSTRGARGGLCLRVGRPNGRSFGRSTERSTKWTTERSTVRSVARKVDRTVDRGRPNGRPLGRSTVRSTSRRPNGRPNGRLNGRPSDRPNDRPDGRPNGRPFGPVRLSIFLAWFGPVVGREDTSPVRISDFWSLRFMLFQSSPVVEHP